MIELEAGDAFVTIDADAGGRVAQIEVGGRALLHDDRSGGPLTWGSYPMVPWAGRIRHGTFTFDGVTHQMPLNLTPHAIHGTTFEMPWEVVDAGRDYCEMRCALAWPLGGVSHQHLTLTAGGLTCLLGVLAQQHALPAVVGWHPNFRKPARAELAFARMYRRDDEFIAVAELVDPRPHPWDDCFVEPLGPLRLMYDDLTVTVDSDCDHWVVFDALDDLTAVEPQSGPPDAFTIGGAVRLEPGELLQRRMTVAWTR